MLNKRSHNLGRLVIFFFAKIARFTWKFWPTSNLLDPVTARTVSRSLYGPFTNFTNRFLLYSLILSQSIVSTASALGIFTPEYGHKETSSRGRWRWNEQAGNRFPNKRKSLAARWSITGPVTSEPYTATLYMLASRHAIQSTRYREASSQYVCTWRNGQVEFETSRLWFDIWAPTQSWPLDR